MVLVMPEELEFQHLWEYRRRENDFDSSCDDSKSTNEPFRQKRKLVLADDDDETSKLKQKDNDNPSVVKNGVEIKNGKAKKQKTRKVSNKKGSNKKGKNTQADPEDVDLHKGATTAYDPSDDVKKFMALLLEDLKVTRESLLKQMVEEMHKLLAENKIPVPTRKKHGHGEKKKSKKVRNQPEKTCSRGNMEQQMDQQKQNVNRQHGNDFENRSTTENCNIRSSGFSEITNADPTHYFNTLGYTGEFGQVTEKTKGGNLSTSAKSNLRTSLADQDAQVQNHHKSVVLAIEAQNSKGLRSCARSVKGKKRSEDHQGGAGSSGQTASSTYLTLPTVLTQSSIPSHGLGASLFNHVPPRVTDKNRGVHQMLETSCDLGSFPVMQTEERNSIFALMGSFPTSGIGTGFVLPHDQGTDSSSSIPRQVNPEYLCHEHNKILPSFRMNGGADDRFPAGGYNLSEHLAVNNHHGCPAYTSDSRFMPYQFRNHKDDSHLFLE